jgi:hypothetical protein
MEASGRENLNFSIKLVVLVVCKADVPLHHQVDILLH